MSTIQQQTTGGDAPQEQSSFGPHVGFPGQHSDEIDSLEEIGHFSGQPIGEGPKQLPNDINNTYLLFLMVVLHSSLSQKLHAAWRREAIVMIAQSKSKEAYLGSCSGKNKLPAISEEKKFQDHSDSSVLHCKSLFTSASSISADIQTEGIDSKYIFNAATTGSIIMKGSFKVKTYSEEITEKAKIPIVSLQRLMFQPLGCIFLGAQTISGFTLLPIYMISMDTRSGPVELLVEVYIVKGMTTPFILGTQLVFADTDYLSEEFGTELLDNTPNTIPNCAEILPPIKVKGEIEYEIEWILDAGIDKRCHVKLEYLVK